MARPLLIFHDRHGSFRCKESALNVRSDHLTEEQRVSVRSQKITNLIKEHLNN